MRLVENCQIVLAIETLVAAQAISLRPEIELGAGTRAAFDLVRTRVPVVERDTVDIDYVMTRRTE